MSLEQLEYRLREVLAAARGANARHHRHVGPLDEIGQQIRRGIFRDLSLGGLSAITQSPVGTGERVSVFFPPQGAHIDLAAGTGGDLAPMVLKLQGGRAPFRWLANGKPLPDPERREAVFFRLEETEAGLAYRAAPLEGGLFRSTAVPGFRLDLKELLERAARVE